jgi:hypothetical protein
MVILKDGGPTEFYFKYNLKSDTPENLASEMVDYFQLDKRKV